MKNLRFIILTILTIFYTGCSTKSIETKYEKTQNISQYKNSRKNHYNEFRFKPIIGTTQEDTKVLIDMGKFAKIWIKNYRNKNKTFVGSHHIITMIKAPGYIAGEDLPDSRVETIRKNYSGHNFAFRSEDLAHNSNTRANLSDEEVKEYINNYQQTLQYNTLNNNKQKQLNKYDQAIKDYLRSKRGEK